MTRRRLSSLVAVATLLANEAMGASSASEPAAWTEPQIMALAGMRPRVSVHENGDTVVVWQSHAWRPTSEKALVWSRFRAAGRGWEEAEVIHDHREGMAEAPLVVALPQGGWMAVWSAHNFGRTPRSLWASVRSREGGWSPAETINEEGLELAGGKAVAVDGLGHVHVLWVGNDIRAGRGRLFHTRSDGVRWEPTEVVDPAFEPFRGERDSDLVLSAGRDGSALAAWWGNGAALLALFEPTRGWVLQPLDARRPAVLPAITHDAEGSALLVGHDGTRVFSQRLRGDRRWEERRPIAGGGASGLSAVYDGQGRAFVMWSERVENAGSRLWVSHLDRGSEAWAFPTLLEPLRSNVGELPVLGVSAAAGVAVAAWTNFRTGHRVVGSAVYTSTAGWHTLPEIMAFDDRHPYAALHDVTVDSHGDALLVRSDGPGIWWSHLQSTSR
jgi:hypothetical protein